jgi:hypothetical protein
MGFTIYDLIKACVLFANAVAILNQRFFKSIGWDVRANKDAAQMNIMNGDPESISVKDRVISLLNGGAQRLLQFPLMWINLLFICVELVMG